jgi:sarcosine oxidase subunit beta
MSQFDVCIIGGGLTGCSAALFLREAGVSVALFERLACGSQASGVNFGGVRQQGRHPEELPLSRRSRAIWSRIESLLETDCEFMVTGHLKLARSEEDMAELERYSAKAAGYGLTLELLGCDTIRRRFDYLGDTVIGGSYCAEDGQANPRLVTPAFARAARKAGAIVYEETEVVYAAYCGEGFEIRTRDGASFRSRALVNVAGAWGSKVAAWFGDSMPEEAIAPNMVVTDPLPYFIKTNIGMCGGGIYLRQIPRGNVIFGSGHGTADRDKCRAYPSDTVTAKGTALAVEVIPRLRHANIIRTWTGIEGRTPDRLPIIGFSQTTPKLVHAFGFSGHGFQMCPAIGAVVTELVLTGESSTPIDAFRLNRFAGWELEPAEDRGLVSTLVDTDISSRQARPL